MNPKRYTAGVDVYGQHPVFYIAGKDGCVFPGHTEFVLAEEYDQIDQLGDGYATDYRRLLKIGTEQAIRIRELETRLTESEQHRAKNRETAVALQDEVTDLRMKLDFRDEENVHLVGEVERLEAALTAALCGASRTDAEASAQEREPK